MWIANHKRHHTNITKQYNEIKARHLTEDELIKKHKIDILDTKFDIAFVKDIIANKHYTLRIEPLDAHIQKRFIMDAKLAEVGGVDYKSSTLKTGDTVYYPDHVYDYTDATTVSTNGDIVYGVTYCDNNGDKQQVYIKINNSEAVIPIYETDAILINETDEINPNCANTNHVMFIVKKNDGSFVEALGAKYCCVGLTGKMLNRIMHISVI